MSQDAHGRFTIVNTFNTIGKAYRAPWPPPEDVSRRMYIYGRFLPEHGGNHAVHIVFKNDNQQIFGHEELRVSINVDVTNVLCQSEFMLEIPELRFKNEIARKVDDQNYETKATLELLVDGELLATAPFWVKYAQTAQG